jgi:hypothetical protein
MIFDQMLQLRKAGSKKNQAKVKKTFSKVKKTKAKVVLTVVSFLFVCFL